MEGITNRDARRSSRLRQVRRRRLSAALLSGLAVCALLLLALFFAGCGTGDQVGDAGPVTTALPDGSNDGEVAPDPTTSTTQQAGGDGAGTQQPTTTVSGASTDMIQISLYFTRGEKLSAAHRSIPRTKEVGAAAMKGLLEGPSAEEREEGDMGTAIPSGTAFLGLAIKDKVATVDLSQEFASGGGTLSMTMRIAQVVNTLTQFSSVDRVAFKLDGKPVKTIGGEGLLVDPPVSRDDYEDVTPAIMVESPTVGDATSSPMRVRGTSNVFEATSQINVVDADGRVIADKTVTASSGTGTRGTFDLQVPFKVDRAQNGALIVFEYSAKDGSKVNVVRIPLELKP